MQYSVHITVIHSHAELETGSHTGVTTGTVTCLKMSLTARN